MNLKKYIGRTIIFVDCATDRLISNHGIITNITDSNEIWTEGYPTGTHLMDEEEEERLYDGHAAWVHINEVYCFIEPIFEKI